MYGDDVIAAGPIADFVTLGEPIIPEVVFPGKELVIVMELELVQPVLASSSATFGLPWFATPMTSNIGQSWSAYTASAFGSVETIAAGAIAAAPDGSASLHAHWEIGDEHGFSDICELLLSVPTQRREAVRLRYEIYLDPAVDYSAVADDGGSPTLAILTFPGMVGGQVWPGPSGLAYPVGGEAQEGNNWSARIRANASGQIAPYLYVQNRPGAFGWHRVSGHSLRINDLRGGWSTWEQDCIMNTPGVADGRCVLRINGDVIVDVSDIEYRSSGFTDVVVNGIRLQAQAVGAASTFAAISFDYWAREFSLGEI